MWSRRALVAAAAAALMLVAAALLALTLARQRVEFEGWPRPQAPESPRTIESGPKVPSNSGR